MAASLRRAVRPVPPGAAERRAALRPSGLLEDSASEGSGHRGELQLHLGEGARAVLQICGGERAGRRGGVPEGAAEQSLRGVFRRNRRVCGGKWGNVAM